MFDSAGGHLQFKTSEYGSRSFLYRYILYGLKTSKEGTMITKHLLRGNAILQETANVANLLKAIEKVLECCNYMLNTSFELQR